MAKERIVNTKFWTDNYITTLDPVEKLLFLYFITNPLTNISGVYELPIKQIAFDSGIESDMVRKIVDRFERDGKVFLRDGWIGIRNFIKNQHTKSADVQEGIKRELSLAPKSILIATFGRGCIEGGVMVGGMSHILNLTKPNLTKPLKSGESNLSLKSSSNQKGGFIPVDFDNPLNKPAKYFSFKGIKYRRVYGNDKKKYAIPPGGGKYILYEELLK